MMLNHDFLSYDECDYDHEPDTGPIFLSELDLPEDLIGRLNFNYIFTSTDWDIAYDEDRGVPSVSTQERCLIDRLLNLAEGCPS